MPQTGIRKSAGIVSKVVVSSGVSTVTAPVARIGPQVNGLIVNVRVNVVSARCHVGIN
jgi:hypothetical protein